MGHVENVSKYVVIKLTDANTGKEYEIYVEIHLTLYGDGLRLKVE